MNDVEAHDEVVYHGYCNSSGAGACVVAVETLGGETLGLLRHVVRHSPAGLNWGYGGSGPADLARSLLIDALGDRALCRQCAGTGYVMYADPEHGGCEEPPIAPHQAEVFDPDTMIRDGCWEPGCDTGYTVAPSLYQQYKWDVIAHLPASPHEWRIHRTEVRDWISSNTERTADD